MLKNKIKTLVLLAALSGLFMFIGSLIGGNQGITIALCMALLMNGIAYFFSDKIVLAMYGARPLDPVQHAHIVATVQELSDRMQLPLPRLWIIDTPVANAFATGRNPHHSSIALTTGIMQLLEPHELRGVLAHEMSHIYNRDILVSTIAATFATAIGYVAHMAQNIYFWQSIQGKREKDNHNLISMLIVAILMPLAATILQLAVSRSREYLADETGAHACHDPLALAGALQKLHNNVKQHHFHETDAARASTATLFIVHPFSKTGGILELFATHPPLEKRIARLHKMYEHQFSQYSR